MFEFVRSNQKLLQTLLLILVLPSFAFIGVKSYMGSGGNEGDVAKVGNETISAPEFDNALKMQAQRANLPEALTHSPGFKSQVLNQMIQQKLLKYELDALNLKVSDERLAKDLLLFPEIAALKGPDGKIDADKYRQLLKSNGLTVSGFENIKKSEMVWTDLQQALAANQQGIYSEAVANRLIDAYATEREVSVVFFLPNEYIKQVTLDSKDMEAYYQSHTGNFQTTATADVDYVILSKASHAKDQDFAKAADNFANLVYEQADSLQPAADNIKSKIEHQNGLTAQGLPALTSQHPLNQAKVLQAIFSDEALKSNKNTDAIALPNGDLISVHVKTFHPAQAKPFADVKPEIERYLTEQKAAELAIQAGKTFTEQLRKDPNVQNDKKVFSKPFWVSRIRPLDLKGEPFEQVFSADLKQIPQYVSANIPGSGMAVYRISQFRQPAKMDPNVRIEEFKKIAGLSLQNELASYFANVRDRAKVSVLKLPQ